MRLWQLPVFGTIRCSNMCMSASPLEQALKYRIKNSVICLIGHGIEEPLPAPIKAEWGCRHVTVVITTA